MENEGYETIDLLEVLNAVRQHLLAVILATVILAAAGFGISKFLITPQYEASALMIVNTRQDITSNVTSDQINSATKLVSTYSIIIKSDTVLQQVIDNLGLSLTYQQLASRVTVSAVDDTQVMKVTVKSDNPEWARQVCEQITVVSPDVILESVEAGSVKVISSAAVNPTPVSPNVGRNTMLGGVLGLVISVGIILLAVLLDNKIHTEDDIAKYLDLAVVGVIPEYQGFHVIVGLLFVENEPAVGLTIAITGATFSLTVNLRDDPKVESVASFEVEFPASSVAVTFTG